MSGKQLAAIAGLVVFEMCSCVRLAHAQSASQQPTATSPDTILLTIFLNHDQSKPLSQINEELTDQGFYKTSPPGAVSVKLPPFSKKP